MKRRNARNKRLSMGEKAEKALKIAVKKAFKEHKKAGVPIVVWKNGKIVKILPEKL